MGGHSGCINRADLYICQSSVVAQTLFWKVLTTSSLYRFPPWFSLVSIGLGLCVGVQVTQVYEGPVWVKLLKEHGWAAAEEQEGREGKCGAFLPLWPCLSHCLSVAHHFLSYQSPGCCGSCVCSRITECYCQNCNCKLSPWPLLLFVIGRIHW